MNRRIIIIGATSAIAQACARHWATEEKAHFVLVGRDQGKLQAIGKDLEIRGTEVTTQLETCDFTDPEDIQTLSKRLLDEGKANLVFIAHGTLPEQQACQKKLPLIREALTINGLSHAYFSEVFAGGLERQNSGSLVIIGSVAGDRGRKSNYVYGAAKGLVERYAQGLTHRLAATNANVTLVKPGPTQTPMTANMPGHENMASLETVAQDILKGVNRGKSVVYAPRKWSLIMFIIRNIPNIIFKRLNI